MNLSYWEKSTFLADIDVAIIGGGIVGLNAAIHLKTIQKSLKVVVIERGFLPFGASTRNAGFACFGSISELLADLKNTSADEVFSLVEKRWKGLQKLRKLMGDDSLHYENLGGYELFKSVDEVLFKNCSHQLADFNHHLKQITGISETYTVADNCIAEFGFNEVTHAILNRSEGQIHTGEMMKHLIQCAQNIGVECWNGVDIHSISEDERGVVLTTAEEMSIRAKKMILATNGFTKKLIPNLDLQPARNQVIVTNPIPNLKVKGTFHYDEGFIYFRNIENRILLGGARNQDLITETTAEFGLTENIKEHLMHFLRNVVLPHQAFTIEHEWSGIMGLGATKQPIVQLHGTHIFLAVRLGGMGVAIGSLVGEEVAELVLQSI
jgi:glycine/D-amino acid oxidase-like deaminating enzyme